MIPAIAIVGHHDSGKTRLIGRILPILVARGLRVGTVKLSPHLEKVDTPGTDSAQHLKAGATRVLLRGETASALFWKQSDVPLAAEIQRHFKGCDLVLVEGGKHSPLPKIEVFRRSGDVRREPLAGSIDVAGFISEERVHVPDEIDVFRPSEMEEIAEFVEALAFGETTGPLL